MIIFQDGKFMTFLQAYALKLEQVENWVSEDITKATKEFLSGNFLVVDEQKLEEYVKELKAE